MIDDRISDEDQEAVERFFTEAIMPLMRRNAWGEAVACLQGELERESGIGRRLLLMSHLSHALIVDRRDNDALAVIHKMIELAPEDPLNWSRLAAWHFYPHGFYDAGLEHLEPALRAIDTAVSKARPSGYLLRYCLNDRCRIAVAMKRYDLLEETMREILAIPPRRGVPDIRIEDDFLQRVPEGAVDMRLLADYRTAYADQESRRASSPPSF
jgi:hypothetical protein